MSGNDIFFFAVFTVCFGVYLFFFIGRYHNSKADVERRLRARYKGCRILKLEIANPKLIDAKRALTKNISFCYSAEILKAHKEQSDYVVIWKARHGRINIVPSIYEDK